MTENKQLLDPRIVASSISKSLYNTIKNGVATDLNRFPDASLTDKGLVQLSNTINTDTTKALTPNGAKVLSDNIGNLNSLNTTNKTSVINAINEVNNKIVDSSESNKGLIQIATSTEVAGRTIANKAIVPKYLPRFIQGITVLKSTLLYVSNQGDDNSADGTEAKPFKTLKKALLYINDNFISSDNRSFTIQFLTDYTESGHLELTGYRHRIYVNGSNHKVTLKTVYVNYANYISFQNLTFKPIFTDEMINNGINAVCNYYYSAGAIDNCIIDLNGTIATKGWNVLISRYHSQVNIWGLEIKANDNTMNSILKCYNLSMFNIDFRGTSKMHIEGDLSVTEAVYMAFNFGFIYVSHTSNEFTQNGVITGSYLYRLTGNSVFDLTGRGDSILWQPNEPRTDIQDNSTVR